MVPSPSYGGNFFVLFRMGKPEPSQCPSPLTGASELLRESELPHCNESRINLAFSAENSFCCLSAISKRLQTCITQGIPYLKEEPQELQKCPTQEKVRATALVQQKLITHGLLQYTCNGNRIEGVSVSNQYSCHSKQCKVNLKLQAREISHSCAMQGSVLLNL